MDNHTINMSFLKIENPVGESPHMKWWFVYNSEDNTLITSVEYCDTSCYVGSKYTLVMFDSKEECDEYIEENQILDNTSYNLDNHR